MSKKSIDRKLNWKFRGKNHWSYIDGRSTCYKRRKDKCELCGTNKKRLYNHHIIPAKYNEISHSPKEGNHSDINLITVCSVCHRKFHIRDNRLKSICVTCKKEFKHYYVNSHGKFCSKKCKSNFYLNYIDKINILISLDYTLKEISKKLNISLSSIQRWRKKYEKQK